MRKRWILNTIKKTMPFTFSLLYTSSEIYHQVLLIWKIKSFAHYYCGGFAMKNISKTQSKICCARYVVVFLGKQEDLHRMFLWMESIITTIHCSWKLFYGYRYLGLTWMFNFWICYVCDKSRIWTFRFYLYIRPSNQTTKHYPVVLW